MIFMGETLNLSLIFSLNPFSFSQKMRTISLATIEARNTVNAHANSISAAINQAFTPYIGKKIKTKQGYWTKKFEKEVLDNIVFSDIVDLRDNERVIIYSSYMSLICEIKLWEPESRTYVCNTIYFGRLNEETGILRELFNPTNHRVDYDSIELQMAIEKVAQLKEELRDAESVIKEFSC